MSLMIGPGPVTTGLVMAYDMSNTKKSFLGKPTTNLYNAVNSYLCGNGNDWTNSGSGSWNYNDTTIPPPDEIDFSRVSGSLRISSCTVTAAGNQQVGMGITPVSASTTYTMSIWVYQTQPRIFQSSPYMRTSVNNNAIGYFAYNGDGNSLNWPANQWIRITATGTTQSNENGIYLSSYIGNNVGDKVYYYGHQVEQGSFATSLVAGTRSTTGAILDLAGITTITATGLTYNSDSTFQFNGTSDKIYQTSIPSSYATVSNSLERSWEVLVKKTGTMTTAAIFGHKVGAGCSYFCNGGIYIWNGNWAMNWYDNSAYQFLDSGISATQNQYFHVVGTFTSNSLRSKIYVNGVLRATSGVTNMNYGGSIAEYSVGYNSKNDFGGGGATDYFQGYIPVVRYYSGKSLSDQEVLQNYYTLKAQYGIP